MILPASAAVVPSLAGRPCRARGCTRKGMDGPDQVAAAPPPADLDEKRRLLLALLLEERGVDPLRAPILPVPRDGRPLPLSFGQERLWLIDQIEPGNVAYNTPSAMRL